MMEGFLLGLTSAFWLGILTSISPCPLASNIAAVSYISRRVGNPRIVLFTGFLYTFGRAVTYVAIGSLLVYGLLSAPYISHLLQKYMAKILGPLLILVGMFLLELIRFTVPGSGVSDKMQKRVDAMGIWGAGLLGIVFALSFCPLSAALFFGSLVPVAVEFSSGIIIPSLYGVGTAIPAFTFAVLIALGAKSVGKAYNRIAQFEWWARRVTGVIFILVGLYLSLENIFNLFS